MTDFPEIAFRRLVYKFSQKLSKEESRALVYIRLNECQEQYQDGLTVLSKLEASGFFSPNNPEGLFEIAQDINRFDLIEMVKDFVKNWKRQRKDKRSKDVGKTVTSFEPTVSDEELQLKAILEVTLSQAALFVKQVDILQQAITAGTKEQRQRAAEAIRDARCTAHVLTNRLQEAQGELERSTSSNSSESEENHDRAEKPPTQALISSQERVQENQDKPMQIPTEETCHAAQGMPLIYQQRMIATSKVKKTEDSSSKLTQPSPSQTLKPKHPKPVVPPKPSWITTSVLKTESPVGHSSDYTNNNDDDAYDLFEKYKQHLCQSPCPEDAETHYYKSLRPTNAEDIEGTEVHYYKSLKRDEVVGDGDHSSTES